MMTTPPPPPTPDYERQALEAAMVICQRQLKAARTLNDNLNGDLLQADLNTMLERWEVLSVNTG